MAGSRTVFEWKITDLSNGQHGYIWISESGKDEFGAVYRIYIDPCNHDSIGTWIGDYRGCNKGDLWNILGNLEVSEDDPDYSHIMFYWRKLGSPVCDPKAPGYEAPYFPWADAGITEYVAPGGAETGELEDIEDWDAVSKDAAEEEELQHLIYPSYPWVWSVIDEIAEPKFERAAEAASKYGEVIE
jgi:hypothetical protein